MLTDCRVSTAVATNELLSFLKNNNINSVQFELLRFVGRHPKAKLGLYVIAKALGTANTELRDALASLTKNGLLVPEIDENGLRTYSLSGVKKTDAYIHELAALDWSEATRLKKLLV